MPNRVGVIVTETEGRTVLPAPATTDQPVLKGEGNPLIDEEWACGQCDTVLAHSVPTGSAGNPLVTCPSCGALNDFPDPPAKQGVA